ncbi:Histidine kinase [Nitrosotalea devaniterrae]|uniref:Histidine kinase n=1 Tax=Nitrosotalea devaniterrae TaxID=1078905 RepID=A0A128A488_9ARCH|nr:Histidine kinase [Candidatus Nitrosotalea devanaterra]
MPIFIDGHDSKDLTQEEIEKLVNLPRDEFGITHLELFFNKTESRLYCVLDAPDEESIWKHHEAAGFKCDFISEVHQIKTENTIKTEKLVTLGQMSSNISHDLRNPMAVIKNSIDLLNIKYKDQLNPGILEHIAKMDRAIFNMSMMVSDILNFARTKSLDLEDHSLTKVITHAISTIIVPSNVKIILPQNDITLKFDEAKLESVFYNLILNAVQSMDQTEGKITIKIIEKIDDKVQIQIQNSGPAIPDELLTKIFEPLFTTKQRGTGLGLPSCKNVVEQHHGTIYASNNPTTFTITLPKHIEKLLAVDESQNL